MCAPSHCNKPELNITRKCQLKAIDRRSEKVFHALGGSHFGGFE